MRNPYFIQHPLVIKLINHYLKKYHAPPLDITVHDVHTDFGIDLSNGQGVNATDFGTRSWFSSFASDIK